VDCQRADWGEHVLLCKNSGLKEEWMSAFEKMSVEFVRDGEIDFAERKRILSDLHLLDNWSKRAVCSNGLLEAMLKVMEVEKCDKYLFSLVGLVDALRFSDGQSIDVDMCFMFVYELNGACRVLNEIVKRPTMHFNQKVSTLRFFRLLASQPKIQAVLLDQLDKLLPLINIVVENAESSAVASELGIFLSSILYSAETPFIHHRSQRLCLEELNIQIWMECAFGNSKWSADMEMGAMELILALLVDVDLFSDYHDLIPENNIEEIFLKYPALLKNLVFGLLDMLIIPKDVFYGAALHGLSLIFSSSLITDEIMKNLWLLTEIDHEADEEASQMAPLPEMLQLLQRDPIVQLTFFRTHVHLNVLKILSSVLSNSFCNLAFMEAAIGNKFLNETLDFVEKRYRQGLNGAQQYKLSHALTDSTKVGNEEEIQDILTMISHTRSLMVQLPTTLSPSDV
jgi:hypothetical protein